MLGKPLCMAYKVTRKLSRRSHMTAYPLLDKIHLITLHTKVQMFLLARFRAQR